MKIGGKIAQLGSRVIESFSKKFAKDFFDRFEICLNEDTKPPTEQVATADPANSAQSAAILGNPALVATGALVALLVIGAGIYIAG